MAKGRKRSIGKNSYSTRKNFKYSPDTKTHMNKPVIAVAVICLLLFLAACESKTTGKRVAIPESSSPKSTGVFTAETKESASATGETGKTAAEVLKELQTTGSVSPPVSGAKSGTFYPPITTDATDKEALKAKTRALMTQGSEVPSSLTKGTLGEFGARYHDSDGDSTNLPPGYEDSSGD